MEKIFDFSFKMPSELNSDAFIAHYFGRGNHEIVKLVGSLFSQLNFSNPRHIKKVLNKYEYLRTISEDKNVLKNNIGSLIPPFYNHKVGNGDKFFTILAIFIIILYEFYEDKFYEIADYRNRIAYLRKKRSELLNMPMRDIGNNYDSPEIPLPGDFSLLYHPFWIKDRYENEYNYSTLEEGFQKILLIFLPKTDLINIEENHRDFVDKFPRAGNEVLLDFCHFLVGNREILMDSKEGYEIFSIFKMARTLL